MLVEFCKQILVLLLMLDKLANAAPQGNIVP